MRYYSCFRASIRRRGETRPCPTKAGFFCAIQPVRWRTVLTDPHRTMSAGSRSQDTSHVGSARKPKLLASSCVSRKGVVALTARRSATIPTVKALYPCGGFAPQVSLTALRDLAPFRQIPTGLFYAPVSQRAGCEYCSRTRAGREAGGERMAALA